MTEPFGIYVTGITPTTILSIIGAIVLRFLPKGITELIAEYYQLKGDYEKEKVQRKSLDG